MRVYALTGLPLVESWGHFPASRRRVLRLLEETKSKGLIILSGDVHFTELLGSKDGVVEFTSSGMTHSLGDMWLVRHVLLPLQRYLYTPKLRCEAFSPQRNFGFIELNYPQ